MIKKVPPPARGRARAGGVALPAPAAWLAALVLVLGAVLALAGLSVEAVIAALTVPAAVAADLVRRLVAAAGSGPDRGE